MDIFVILILVLAVCAVLYIRHKAKKEALRNTPLVPSDEKPSRPFSRK